MSEWKETEYGIIAADWSFIPSTQFCLRVTDGTHDSPKEQSTGKYLITSKHIKGRVVDFESAYLISEEDFNKINQRSKVDQWDVIISMIGEYCGFCFVERNENVEYAVKNVGLFKTGNRHRAFWLYYYLNSKIGRFILETNKSGTSQPYLSLGSLRQLPILYPPTEKEANSIVEILNSLDDKIDLLHRQNKTLEAMAETLFRQWFVEEADEGWEEKSIGYLFDITSGKGLKKEKLIDSGIYPVLGANGEIGRTDDYLYDESLLYTGRVGTLGNVFISHKKKVWLSDNTLVIRPFKFFYSTYFILKASHLEEYNVGSTQPLIRQSDVKAIEMLLPPEKVFYKFEEQANVYFTKIFHNQSQIRILEKLSDTLLPKLLSGEVRVKDGE